MAVQRQLWWWFAVPQYTFADEESCKHLLDSLPLSEDGSPATRYASLHQRKAHYFWWGNRPFCTHCESRTDVWRASSENSTQYECMQCGVFRVKRVRLMSKSEVMAQNVREDFGSWEVSAPSTSTTSATPSFQEILFNQMTSIFQYMGDRLRPALHPDAWRAALMLAKLLGLDCLPPKQRLNLEAFGLEDGRVVDPDVVSCAYIGTRVLDHNAMCWGAFRYWKQISWQRTQAISWMVLGQLMPIPDWRSVLPVLWAEELVAEDLTRAVQCCLETDEAFFFNIFTVLHELVSPNTIAVAYAFLRVAQVRKAFSFTYWDELYPGDFRVAVSQLDVHKKLRVHGLPLADFLKREETQTVALPSFNKSTGDARTTDKCRAKDVGGSLTQKHKAEEVEERFRLIRVQYQQRWAFNLAWGGNCKYGDVLVDEGMMRRLLEGVDFAEELQPIRDVLRTEMEVHLSVEQRLDYDTNQLQNSGLDVDLQFLSRSNLEAQRAFRMKDLALEKASKAEVIATVSSWLIPIPSLLESCTDAELRGQFISWNMLGLLLDKPLCIEDLTDVSSRAAMMGLLTRHIAKYWRDYDGDGVEIARQAMRKMVVSNACHSFDVAHELPRSIPVSMHEMGGPEGYRLLRGQARQLFRCVKAVEFYLGEGVWGECPALFYRHPTWATLEKSDNMGYLNYVLAANLAADAWVKKESRDAFLAMQPAAGSQCQRLEQKLDGQAAAPGGQSLPLVTSFHEVVPFLRKLLRDGKICRPATNLPECSTSQQLVAALQALGMPFDVEEKVLTNAVEEVRAESTFHWMFRPMPGKGPLHPWARKSNKEPARRKHKGKNYGLYSVHLLALPAEVAWSQVETQPACFSAVAQKAEGGGVDELKAEVGRQPQTSTTPPADSSPPAAGSESSVGPILEALMPPPPTDPVADPPAPMPPIQTRANPDSQPSAEGFPVDDSAPEKRKRQKLDTEEVEKVTEAPGSSPPAGDTKQQCQAYAEAVLPAMRHALQQPEGWGRRPPRTLDDCLTTHEFIRRLAQVIAPPPHLNEDLAMAAILRCLLKEGLVHRAGQGEGGLVVAVQRSEVARREDTASGKSCQLLFVSSPVAEEPEVDCGSAQATAAATPPTDAGSSLPAGDIKQQCRAYAEAMLPAVRHGLRQAEGWGRRPPRTLEDCLTTQEFGRRLLALIGPHPAHLEEEAVTAAVLRRVVEEGLVHRAGLGEGGAVVAVRRADVARREDAVSSKSCQLLFVSLCEEAI